MSALETYPAATVPFDLTVEDSVLVVQAHPDDELFTASAMHSLIEANVPVTAVVATDGESSTKGNPDFVLAGLRRSEVQRSLGIIGIAALDQHYLELPDGRLDEWSVRSELVRSLQRIIHARDITTVITPGAYGVDGHSDHRAVHTGALSAARELRSTGGQALRDVRIWSLGSAAPDSRSIAVDAALKQRIIAAHPSQFGRGMPENAELQSYEPLISGVETYRPISY